MKTCTIEGCDKRHKGRGLCGMHWNRQNRHGSPYYVTPPGPKAGPAKFCGVDGCGRAHHGKGLCRPHWERLRKFGDPYPAVPLDGTSIRKLLAPEPDPTCVDCDGRIDTGGIRCRPCMMADLHKRLDARPVRNPKGESGDPGRVAVRQVTVPSRNMRAA